MSVIRCPYCRSEHVSQQEMMTDAFGHFYEIFESMSPANMMRLGIKLAKSLSIPPYVGGAIGLLVGGTLIVVSRHLLHKYGRPVCYYICNDCQQDFAIAL